MRSREWASIRRLSDWHGSAIHPIFRPRQRELPPGGRRKKSIHLGKEHDSSQRLFGSRLTRSLTSKALSNAPKNQPDALPSSSSVRFMNTCLQFFRFLIAIPAWRALQALTMTPKLSQTYRWVRTRFKAQEQSETKLIGITPCLGASRGNRPCSSLPT